MFLGPRLEELLAAAENFGNLEQCQSKTTNTLCRIDAACGGRPWIMMEHAKNTHHIPALHEAANFLSLSDESEVVERWMEQR